MSAASQHMLGEESFEDLFRVNESPTSYRKGEFVFQDHPAGIYCVHSGLVRTYDIFPDGRQSHVDFYRPGEFFGIESIAELLHGRYCLAAAESQVSHWNLVEVQHVLLTHATAYKVLAREYHRQLRRLSRRLELTALPIDRRLALTLVGFADHLGAAQADGATYLLPPMTHDFMASIIATSREVITSHMVSFSKANLLRYSRRSIVIDRPALIEYGRSQRERNAA